MPSSLSLSHTHPPLCRRTGKGAGRLTLRQRPCFPKVDHEVFEVFEAEHRLVQPLPIVGLRKAPTSVYATPVLCQLEDSESWRSLGKKDKRSKIKKEEHAQTTSTMDSLQTGSHQREAEVSTHARRKRKREETHSAFNPTLLSASDQAELYPSSPPSTECPARQTPPDELFLAPNNAAFTPSRNT
jgi:hypothetical protein